MATIVAVLLVPDDPTAPGALFYSALVMSAGLAIAPLAAALRQPKAILRGESLLALAPIYWLLLDLLQGVYSLDHISAEEVRLAFIGIGLFVGMVWVGAIRRPWRIPAVFIRSVSQEFSLNTYFACIGLLRHRHVELRGCVRQRVSDGPLPGPGTLVGAVGPRTTGRLGRVSRSLAILRLSAADSVGRNREARRLTQSANVDLHRDVDRDDVVSGAKRQPRVIGVVAGMALVLWVLDQRQLRIKHLLGTGSRSLRCS